MPWNKGLSAENARKEMPFHLKPNIVLPVHMPTADKAAGVEAKLLSRNYSLIRLAIAAIELA